MIATMHPTGHAEALFQLEISAASGLVLLDDTLWVMADDRLALDRYRIVDGRPLAPVELHSGAALGIQPKKKKRDLEALLDIGAGQLLVLGSGSKPNRERGYRVDTHSGRVEQLDLSPLYARLGADIEDLNIEGALRRGPDLLLAHRAVGRAGQSCIVRLDAETCLASAGLCFPASSLIDITRVDLGLLESIPLAFTDLALGPDGAVFYVAAAEITDDPYLDGHCVGSVFGRLDEKFGASTILHLHPRMKAEGLAWRETDRWLLVTDADDPARRASVLQIRWT